MTITIRTQKHFGWIPDIPDVRDLFYKAPKHIKKARPNSMDLRPRMPEVWDQGNLGSCVAQAVGANLQYLQIKQNQESFTPSKLFIYYNARKVDGCEDQDSGAMIRDGIKVVNEYGACRENPTWPYDISKFRDRPSFEAYKEGEEHQALIYQRVDQTAEEIESRIFEGFPVVIGITVYDSFLTDEVERTGIVPMPGKDEHQRGGHAVLICGYERKVSTSFRRWFRCGQGTAQGRFIARNSWGKEWGAQGYFTIPYDYVLNSELADDLWTIERVE